MSRRQKKNQKNFITRINMTNNKQLQHAIVTINVGTSSELCLTVIDMIDLGKLRDTIVTIEKSEIQKRIAEINFDDPIN
jgi:hypothetical protein